MNTYKKTEIKKDEKYPYPSHYGSHSSMLIDIETLNEKELEEYVKNVGVLTSNRVVCKDEFGYYVTFPDRLDNGLHDSRRTDAKRMNGEYYQSIVNVKDNRK